MASDTKTSQPFLKLLGAPSYIVDDQEQALPHEHPLLLLTYLNAHEAWIDRKEILALVFEDDDESVARNKLRQLLFRAKKQAWFQGFESRPQHLKHDAITDLRAFRKAIEQAEWGEAVKHYNGPLLQDTAVTLKSYEAWLDNEREDIEGSFEEASNWYAKTLQEEGQHDDASRVLLKLLDKDPLNEEAMQSYLQSALQSSQLQTAIDKFENFKTQLERDLSMQPLDETTALANTLIDAQNQKTLNKLKEPKSTELEVQNMPKGLVPFVGRDPELTHLLSLLEQKDTQLLSLIGIGGMGKTRLSIATASDYVKTSQIAAAFVPLDTINSADFIANSILTALALEPNAKQEASEQIIDFLKEKPMLLVLDNFEHVMQGKALVQDLLDQLPKLKIFVTSRERLNLSFEQIFELTGMTLPDSLNENTEFEAYDATKLFLKAARRNNPSFTLNPNNRQDIFDLCKTVQGVPLALELAASWLRMMTIDEILEEVTESFELLETDFSDLPDRHQSLRAVFESSWQLLTKEEQETLIPLAAFSGGFTLDAAKQITGAKSRHLLRLVNKSLLRRNQKGRFEFLEVIRQYTQEKLEQNTALSEAINEKHAAYFLELCQTAEPHLKGSSEQFAWLNQLEDEHNNLRKAFNFFMKSKKLEDVYDLANNLFDYWFIRGHWNEAQQNYEQLISQDRRDELSKPRARATAYSGYIATTQGHYQAATERLQRSVEIFRELNEQADLAYTLLCQGLNANYQANYQEAQSLFQESLRISESLNEQHGMSNALNELGIVAIRQGQFDKARQNLERSLAIREDIQDERGQAQSLANLGIIARRQGNYAETEALYQQSLELSRKNNYQIRTANTLIYYGVLVKLQKRYQEAENAYTEALDIFQKVSDKLGEAIILENMATLYRLQEDFKQAKHYCERCLENHEARNDQWGMAKVLNELAIIACQENDYQKAQIYLARAYAIIEKLNDKQLLTQNLRWLAVSFWGLEEDESALLVLAKATALANELNLMLEPTEQAQVEKVQTHLRTKFTEDGFRKISAKAKAMAAEELMSLLSQITFDETLADASKTTSGSR